MSVAVDAVSGFPAGKAEVAFEADPGWFEAAADQTGGYDVSPDGQRFYVVKADQGAPPRTINVALNWFEELKRRVPSE
jgi:hypothetical protein